MKADYGIRALLDLAEHSAGGPVPSHDIAARQHIPGPFLDQLLMTLRRAGLVRSTRGPRGGHMLGPSPDDVTLAVAVDVLEGQAGQMEGLAVPEACEQTFGAAIRGAILRADAAARATLEEITLADLLNERRAQGVFHGIYKPLPAEGPVA